MSILSPRWSIRPSLSTFFFSLLLLLSSATFGQRIPASKPTVIKATAVDWQLDATVSEVKFYHAIITCDGAKAVLLRFDNQNKFPVSVSWREVFSTQMDVKVEGSKGLKELTIPTGVTMPSSCNDQALRLAVITKFDVQPHYIADILAFGYKDITVKKAK